VSGLNGSAFRGLLHERHAEGCDGQEYSTARPVAFGAGFAVVYCEWCGDCGAADYQLVDYVEPTEEVARHL
jgi:hypothetical protein